MLSSIDKLLREALTTLPNSLLQLYNNPLSVYRCVAWKEKLAKRVVDSAAGTG
jgi:hypothetical protein